MAKVALPGLVLAVLLAGCFGGGKPGGSPDPENGDGQEGPFTLDPPTWAVRDFWTYDTPFGEATYVVTEDAGQDWILDITNQDTAWYDAQTDVSRLGPVRKSDLAGSQGSDRVEFFHWPVTMNDTWQTTWDGLALTIQVLEVDEDSALFSAVNATGGLVYAYEYDEEFRWFETLTSYDAAGAEAFSLSISEHGHNFTGDVYRWTFETLVDYAALGPGNLDVQQVTVGDAVTDLWLRLAVQCDENGGYSYALYPAGSTAVEDGYEAGDQCTPPGHIQEGPVVEAPAPGQWASVVLSGGGPTPVDAEVLLLARTLETIAVG